MLFQIQFENYLKKVAVDSLKMTADEFQHLREEHNQNWVIDELQRESLGKRIVQYNLRALKESLTRDHNVASRTHLDWQPSEVRESSQFRFDFIVISKKADWHTLSEQSFDSLYFVATVKQKSLEASKYTGEVSRCLCN